MPLSPYNQDTATITQPHLKFSFYPSLTTYANPAPTFDIRYPGNMYEFSSKPSSITKRRCAPELDVSCSFVVRFVRNILPTNYFISRKRSRLPYCFMLVSLPASYFSRWSAVTILILSFGIGLRISC